MAKLYKAKELAEILGCNPQTIYRMADRGEIESIKIGTMRRFLMPERERNNDIQSRRQGADNDPVR
ncbi:MAG: helix-turn-helix domain-containing protein [Acutalibacteraceae bacterium]|nr:helix-turn-helix domain-containing protein [Acutalibacteraceae bacterium]